MLFPESATAVSLPEQVGGDHYLGPCQPWDLIKAMKSSGNPFADYARATGIAYLFRIKGPCGATRRFAQVCSPVHDPRGGAAPGARIMRSFAAPPFCRHRDGLTGCLLIAALWSQLSVLDSTDMNTSEHWLDTAKRDELPGGSAMNVRRFLVIHFTSGASGQAPLISGAPSKGVRSPCH